MTRWNANHAEVSRNNIAVKFTDRNFSLPKKNLIESYLNQQALFIITMYCVVCSNFLSQSVLSHDDVCKMCVRCVCDEKICWVSYVVVES